MYHQGTGNHYEVTSYNVHIKCTRSSSRSFLFQCSARWLIICMCMYTLIWSFNVSWTLKTCHEEICVAFWKAKPYQHRNSKYDNNGKAYNPHEDNTNSTRDWFSFWGVPHVWSTYSFWFFLSIFTFKIILFFSISRGSHACGEKLAKKSRRRLITRLSRAVRVCAGLHFDLSTL